MEPDDSLKNGKRSGQRRLCGEKRRRRKKRGNTSDSSVSNVETSATALSLDPPNVHLRFRGGIAG
ncbi:hypothetical protein CH375_15075 [Leptospira ellisii]|nr:hypothetical protein CH375_15075 [Leptospira ellisii]